MASIEKRQRSGETRWYARYRDPAGRQRVKVFDRKVDAERYLTTVESAKMVGAYVDPALATTSEPATVRKIHRVLSLILELAVRDGRLARNPAGSIKLPRAVVRERRYLTHRQVDQ